MAKIRLLSKTTTSIMVDIDELSGPQNTYANFRMRVGTGAWVEVGVQSGYTGYDSPNYNFTNLSPGTSYTIYGEAKMGSAWYSVTPLTVTTDSVYVTPAPTWFTLSAPAYDRVTGSWGAVSGATQYQMAIYSPTSKTTTVSSTSATITGLSASTYYYAYVRAYSSAGGWSAWSPYDYAVTPAAPKTPAPTNFTMTAVNSTSVQGSWSSVPNATLYEYQIYSPISRSVQTSLTNATLTNLSPNTYYYGYVRAYTAALGWSDWSTYAIALTPQGRPSNFAWTYAKTSGGSFNLTATEWNNFTARINAFRTYKGLATTTFTQATSNANFTATMFNQARNSINGLIASSSIPATKSSGDPIRAADLNALVTILNSVT